MSNITKFYTYYQNNSYGIDIISEKKGIGKYVIIEAYDYNHANNIAIDIGIYFDGVNNDEIDCPCCGDRWSKIRNEDEGYNEPKIFNELLNEYKAPYKEAECYIHYIDKPFEKIIIEKE